MDDSSDDAIVTTYQRPWIRMLDGNPEAELVRELPEGGREYRLPARLIKPRMPRKQTEESKAAARDRMAKARAAKSSGQ